MKRFPLLLLCLLLSAVAMGADEAAFDEVDKLVRLRDYPQAVRHLQLLATQGSAEAQFRLAGHHRSGKGVAADHGKSRELYHQAALAGHAEAQFVLARLFDKSKDPAATLDARKWYRLAAAQGHERAAARLEMLDESSPANREISSSELFNAIRHNDETLINTLITNGSDLDLVDAQGNTVVLAALLSGWPRLAGRLIPQTSYPGQANTNGILPLQLASGRDYRDIVVALLDRQVDINEADTRGETALMVAIKNMRSGIAELLLERGADAGLKNNKNQSAIDIAMVVDNAQGRVLLEDHGVKPGSSAKAVAAVDLEGFRSAVSKHGARYAGWPLLNIAIELGETRLAGEIIEQGTDLAATDTQGNSALLVAARNGRVTLMRQLLAQAADANAFNRDRETALHLAVDSRCLQCVDLLLQRRANPSIESGTGVTPVEAAIQSGQMDLALRLLAAGGDYAGIHRAVLIAMQKGLDRFASELVELDSRIPAVDAAGRTLLWHGADQGLEKAISKLVSMESIDLDRRDSEGHSAISRAVIRGHVKIFRLLADSGADLSLRTSTGNSLLMLAVLGKQAEIVELLLARRVDVNASNNSGNTVLMMAAAGAQNDVVEQLIVAGSDLQLRNREDMNAFQIATESGHRDTAQLIHDSSNLIFKLFN